MAGPAGCQKGFFCSMRPETARVLAAQVDLGVLLAALVQVDLPGRGDTCHKVPAASRSAQQRPPKTHHDSHPIQSMGGRFLEAPQNL